MVLNLFSKLKINHHIKDVQKNSAKIIIEINKKCQVYHVFHGEKISRKYDERQHKNSTKYQAKNHDRNQIKHVQKQGSESQNRVKKQWTGAWAKVRPNPK